MAKWQYLTMDKQPNQTKLTRIECNQGCGVGAVVEVARSRANEPGVGVGVDQTTSTPTPEHFVGICDIICICGEDLHTHFGNNLYRYRLLNSVGLHTYVLTKAGSHDIQRRIQGVQTRPCPPEAPKNGTESTYSLSLSGFHRWFIWMKEI